MITYQDYAAAHRRQQLQIWALIESGEMQKAVDIFAAGIQYGENVQENGDKKTLTKRRYHGIIRICRKIIRVIIRKYRRRKK